MVYVGSKKVSDMDVNERSLAHAMIMDSIADLITIRQQDSSLMSKNAQIMLEMFSPTGDGSYLVLNIKEWELVTVRDESMKKKNRCYAFFKTPKDQGGFFLVVSGMDYLKGEILDIPCHGLTGDVAATEERIDSISKLNEKVDGMGKILYNIGKLKNGLTPFSVSKNTESAPTRPSL